MQRLEVSGVVRLIYRSLGVKGLNSRTAKPFKGKAHVYKPLVATANLLYRNS